MPVAAMEQGSPSLVAIVIGGYGFAHGEPGAMADEIDLDRRGICTSCSTSSRLLLAQT